MPNYGFAILCPIVIAGLVGCASAPRGPASTVADAGRKTTGALGKDIRDIAGRLEYADVSESFAITWDRCSNPRLTCSIQEESASLSEDRRLLARAVAHRAKAVDALHDAYAALQTEAEYDGKADLASATSSAVSNVVNFAGVVGVSIPGNIGQLAAGGAEFIAGIVGEQRQRKRLLRANALIADTTILFRQALARESAIFDLNADYLEGKRFAAITALLEAGLISHADLMTPMVQRLNVKLVPNADAVIAKSPAAQKAVQATVKATSRAEIRELQARYQASLAALDTLIAGHADLAAERPISIEDVERMLTELDLTLTRHLGDDGD